MLAQVLARGSRCAHTKWLLTGLCPHTPQPAAGEPRVHTQNGVLVQQTSAETTQSHRKSTSSPTVSLQGGYSGPTLQARKTKAQRTSNLTEVIWPRTVGPPPAAQRGPGRPLTRPRCLWCPGLRAEQEDTAPSGSAVCHSCRGGGGHRAVCAASGELRLSQGSHAAGERPV